MDGNQRVSFRVKLIVGIFFPFFYRVNRVKLKELVRGIYFNFSIFLIFLNLIHSVKIIISKHLSK